MSTNQNTDAQGRPQEKSIKQLAVSGSIWTVLGFGLTQLFRLGSNILLAALLFEEAFALMAIVLAISQGLSMFSDIGLGPSIVQNKRGDDRNFLDTAWTIQIIRSVILASILFLIAHPLAAFYAQNDPFAWELEGLMKAIALSTIIAGFQSTKILTASRHLNLAAVTILQLAIQVTGMSVSVILAWKTGSVYSLVYGAIASAILTATLSHLILPGQNNRIHWDTSAGKEIIRFGIWILFSTSITFLAMQLDKLAFSRLFPLSEVGVYSIAFGVALLGPLLMGRLVFAVAFPSFSRVLDSGADLGPAVKQAKAHLFSIGAYLTAGLVCCGAAFVEVAYDERYQNAGLYIPILAAGAWFAIIEGVYGSALLANGKANWTAATNAAKVVAFCILLWPGAYLGGILGAVIVVSISEVFKMAVGIWGGSTINLTDRKPELFYTAYWVIASTTIVIFSNIFIDPMALPGWLKLLIEMLVVTICFAPLLWKIAYRVLNRRDH
ncbi:MAG: oligosaccharide flippase family protein [Acidiferrobacterales bacterium]|nr:oligosaccharide flippase family protein [Acidiferrobacterales bacterium]